MNKKETHARCTPRGFVDIPTTHVRGVPTNCDISVFRSIIHSTVVVAAVVVVVAVVLCFFLCFTGPATSRGCALSPTPLVPSRDRRGD